jgi:hypothetical protein
VANVGDAPAGPGLAGGFATIGHSDRGVDEFTGMLRAAGVGLLVDVETDALLLARDLSFRGDTDEGWRKMAGFLAHTLAEPRN